METTETPIVAKTYPKKNCEVCGSEFDVKKPDARFCGTTCRGRAFRNNNKKSNAPNADANESKEDFPVQRNHLVATLNGLPAHAQYIISHLNGQLSEKKEELKRLRDKHDALKQSNTDLKEKIAKIEVNHKLEAIENSKPSGLQGIMQNLGSLPPELVASLAPALGKLVDKLFGGADPQLPIAGTDGQLDSEVQHKIVSFNTWFATLPKNLQDALYASLVKLANSPSESALQQSLTKIQTILNQHVTTQTVPFTGTIN